MLQLVQCHCYRYHYARLDEDCVRDYDDLDSRITSDKNLPRKLIQVFYDPGKGAPQYVKLNYSYLVGHNCSTNKTTTYIWSESVLYFLGPPFLVSVTLLAVKNNVNNLNTFQTIELPCLCADDDDQQAAILDFLTYMVKTTYLYTYVIVAMYIYIYVWLDLNNIANIYIRIYIHIYISTKV